MGLQTNVLISGTVGCTYYQCIKDCPILKKHLSAFNNLFNFDKRNNQAKIIMKDLRARSDL